MSDDSADEPEAGESETDDAASDESEAGEDVDREEWIEEEHENPDDREES